MAFDYPVIDVHTHIFNTHFVPITEIINNKFGVPRGLAKVLGRVLNKITGTFPIDDTKKHPSPEKLLDRRQPEGRLAVQIVEAVKRAVMDELTERTRKEVGGNLSDSELFEALHDLAKYRTDEFPVLRYSKRQASDKLEDLLTERPTFDENIKRLQRLNSFLDGWIGDKLLSIFAQNSGMVRFAALMLYDQEKLVQKMLQENYKPNQNVQLFVHLMMDMEKAYHYNHRKPVSPHLSYPQQQFKAYKERVQEGNGRLVGFVSFDPRRRSALSQVKKALCQGNVGVKLYPPMGYRPDDSRTAIGKRFDELFEYCIDQDIPILTHCTPVGFEAQSGWGRKYSHPNFWANVLQRGSCDQLRLCFGHSGGGTYKVQGDHTSATSPTGREIFRYWGWFAKNERDWRDEDNYTRCIIELCQQYPNVYCDFSYLHELFDKEKRRLFVKRFRSALNTDSDYPFGDKIMYGSDWHMGQITGRTSEFLNEMKRIVDSIDPDLGSRLFYQNALRFLRLDAFLARQDEGFFSDEARQHLEQLAGLPH
jgi:predicted TIM-barrel fold metal-dependent hydrolase